MVEFQAGARDWSGQTVWYVDQAAGDDRNDGAAALSPLASVREIVRRLRGVELRAVYTINVTGDLDDLPVDFDVGDGGFVDIVFAFTAGATVYVVNAYTAANPAGTAEVDKIQTVAAGTAAGLVDKRIRFTSGPATALTAYATRALAGYDDRTFEMTMPYGWVGGTWVTATPANGNTFVVDTLPVVSHVSVHIRRRGGQGFCFAVRNAQFGTLANPIQDPIFSVEGWGISVGCAWYASGFQTDGYHISDAWRGGSVIRGTEPPVDKARFIGCYMKGNFLLSNVLIWNSLFKHGHVGVEQGAVHFIGLVGVMIEVADAIQDAVWLFDASCRLIINTNGMPTGYTLILNQTRYAFDVPPGAVVAYTAKPICSTGGGAHWARVGSTVRTLATDVPYIEPASNAAVIAGMLGSIG